MALSPTSHIHVAIGPVDFRKGIRGLKRICRSVLEERPDSGAIFVFRNRKMTSIKILAYDGQGFWLLMKRLSSGKFPHWPNSCGVSRRIDYREFHSLINAAVSEPCFAKDWKPVLKD